MITQRSFFALWRRVEWAGAELNWIDKWECHIWGSRMSNIFDILEPPAFQKYSIFLFNVFLHVFCNPTKTITNSRARSVRTSWNASGRIISPQEKCHAAVQPYKSSQDHVRPMYQIIYDTQIQIQRFAQFTLPRFWLTVSRQLQPWQFGTGVVRTVDARVFPHIVRMYCLLLPSSTSPSQGRTFLKKISVEMGMAIFLGWVGGGLNACQDVLWHLGKGSKT